MKIATILFVYSRSKHTQAVLEGLQKNYVLPEKLFIFQDGPKASTDRKEWDKVNALIRGVSFCPTELVVSETNKGLFSSLLTGIAYVLTQCDAFIVIEDDCVPDKNFMNYMVQCLKKYENENDVYTICGFSYPMVHVPDDGYDVYFNGRFACWGWGTWKNRWEKYDNSPEAFRRVMDNPKLSMGLGIWAKELPRMCLDNLNGKNEGWDIYWALNIIEHQGLCVSPYVSLIQNIGIDGTGVHCGVMDEYNVPLENKERKIFSFPEHIAIREETRKAFLASFGSYAALQTNRDLEHIVVYGLGNYYFKYEKTLTERYYIEAYMDRSLHGYFAGRPIISKEMLKDYKDKNIVIMLKDRQECERVKKELHSVFGTLLANIIIGSEIIENLDDSF